MSQPSVELSPDSNQNNIYDLQYGLLPLLRVVNSGGNHINRPGEQLFSHQSSVGRLSVRHALELLHVDISDQLDLRDSDDDTPFLRDDAAETISLRASYQLTPDDSIVPMPLYTGLNFAVRMYDDGHWHMGRYVPKYLPESGGILESDIEGPLSAGGFGRLENFVQNVVGRALEQAAKPDVQHLQLVQP